MTHKTDTTAKELLDWVDEEFSGTPEILPTGFYNKTWRMWNELRAYLMQEADRAEILRLHIENEKFLADRSIMLTKYLKEHGHEV